MARVERTAIFRDDSGSVGYVQYAVTAVPTKTIKGELGHESKVRYRLTVEHDPSSEPPVVPGRRYVVFLKRNEDGQLWLFSEVAQFASSPGLLRRLGVD